MEISTRQIAEAIKEGTIVVTTVDDKAVHVKIGNRMLHVPFPEGESGMDILDYISTYSTDEIAEQIHGVIEDEQTAAKNHVPQETWNYITTLFGEKTSDALFCYEIRMVSEDASDGTEQKYWQKDPLIDIVYAASPQKAVAAVANKHSLPVDRLYAEDRYIKAPILNSQNRISAQVFVKKNCSGIMIQSSDSSDIITVNASDSDSGVSFSVNYLHDADKRFYVLDYNSEYLENSIVAGPLTEKEAKEALRGFTVSRLVQLNIFEDGEIAESLYDELLKDSDDIFSDANLEVNENSSTIYYAGYEEDIDIVQY